MDDAAIRTLFRELGEVTFGTPRGHVSVTPDALAERGLDVDDAAGWVEAHGGYVERPEYRRRGLGPSYGKVDVFVRFIVPESALEG